MKLPSAITTFLGIPVVVVIIYTMVINSMKFIYALSGAPGVPSSEALLFGGGLMSAVGVIVWLGVRDVFEHW